MFLHVSNPGIFCRVLFFLGVVQQKIEARKICVAIDHALRLLRLKAVKLMNCL